jgi:hypothetical protein
MMRLLKLSLLPLLLIGVICISCVNDDDIDPIGINDSITNGAEVPEIYLKIYGASSITSDGTFVTIKTSGAPDHKSIYYASSSLLYENFSGTTFGGNEFQKNPNSIQSFAYSFKIPINPSRAANTTATQLGAIGVSLNGVPFYNQYAGPNQPLTNEVGSFDQYYGHPQASGAYHYHVEPIYLTEVVATKSALMGFLLDGFPVYGPEENGSPIEESSLDAFHGHTTATDDYPNGIYHYHITNKDPYLNGSGYYGTPGTVSQ